MKTYSVGGLIPFHRTKTLSEALEKAQDDDTIVLHKSISEFVTINKNVIIQGQGHTLTVPKGKMGIHAVSPCEIHDLKIKAESRANAIVADGGIVLDKVDLSLLGPIRQLYPLLILNASKPGKIVIDDSKLMSVQLAKTGVADISDTVFTSYYKGDVCLSTRADMSYLAGKTTLTGCDLRSIIMSNADLTSCTIDRYVDIDGKANLQDCTINIKEDEVKKNAYKNEPSSGPLKDKTDAKYALRLSPNSEAVIKGLGLENSREGFLSVYANKASLVITDTDLEDKGGKNKIIDTNLSLKNTHDKNFWQIEGNSPTAYVRSTLNASRQYETAMQKLDKMIGQNSVKDQIHTIMATVEHQNQTSNKDFDFSYNMIFAGDPGTGKTSIARIVAQALFEVGAIPQNKFTQATSDEFVKGYVGQSGENTRRILDKALGGVLFIDEAYQLTVKEGEKSFNSDVLSVLIRYMEDHRSDLVVIAAGYDKEMKEFLASNVGLSRRFQWIHFDDYTNHELAEIFELMRSSYGDSYADPRLQGAIEPLFAKLTAVNLSIPDANGRVTNGGNGGLCRNVYQDIAQARNKRVTQYGGMDAFTKDDIAQGFTVEINKALARRM